MVGKSWFTGGKALRRLMPVPMDRELRALKKASEKKGIARPIAIALRRLKLLPLVIGNQIKLSVAVRESIGRPRIAQKLERVFEKYAGHPEDFEIVGKIRIPKGLNARQRKAFRERKLFELTEIRKELKKIKEGLAPEMHRQLKNCIHNPTNGYYFARIFNDSTGERECKIIEKLIFDFSRKDNPTPEETAKLAVRITSLSMQQVKDELLEAFQRDERLEE